MTTRALPITSAQGLRRPHAVVNDSGDRVRRLDGTSMVFGIYVALIIEQYLGIGQQFPLLMATKVPTLLNFAIFGVVLYKVGVRRTLTEYPQSRMLTVFVAFTGVSIIWAIVQREVPEVFRYHLGYLGFFAVTLYVVDSVERITKLSYLFMSMTMVLVLRNVDKLGQARDMSMGEFVAGFFMTDGNDFGWGLNTLLPFAIFLMLGQRRFFGRMFGLAGLGAIVVGIAATQSRGATLAIGAAVLYWVLISKRKVISIALVAASVLVGGALASRHYVNRLETIVDYQEDDSAAQRIRAWKSAVRMANDYPLGVGANNFSAAYGMFYIPEDTSGFMAYRWMSAHSVYFKMLGEYGYGGLVLLLVIIGSSLASNHRSGRAIRRAPTEYQIPAIWPLGLNIGLIGYAIAAIFLGGLSYPHVYLLCGLTAGVRRIMALGPAAAEVETSIVGGRAATVRPHGIRGQRVVRPGVGVRKALSR